MAEDDFFADIAEPAVDHFADLAPAPPPLPRARPAEAPTFTPLPPERPPMDRGEEESAFDVAARRQRQAVQPPGGRTEGATTKVLEHFVPSAGESLLELAKTPGRGYKGELTPEEELSFGPSMATQMAMVGIPRVPAATPRLFGPLSLREAARPAPEAAPVRPVEEAAPARPVEEAPPPRTPEEVAAQPLKEDYFGDLLAEPPSRVTEQIPESAVPAGEPAPSPLEPYLESPKDPLKPLIEIEKAAEEGPAKPAEPAPKEPLAGEELFPPVKPAKGQKRAPTLSEYIRANGGIELTPEARDMGLDKGVGKNRIARKGGKSIDDFWREHLAESGYIPYEPDGYIARDIRGELYEMLRDEQQGRPHYSIHDQEIVPQPKPDERAPAIEGHAQSVADAFEEAGIPRAELDTEALYEAADSLYRGESKSPIEAYDRAAVRLGERDAQSAGVRGGSEEVYPPGGTDVGSRIEKAATRAREGQPSFGPASRVLSKEKQVPVEIDALRHLQESFQERTVDRKGVATLRSQPLHAELDALDIRGRNGLVTRAFVERLRHAAGDTPVHYITDLDMARFRRSEPGTWQTPSGLWVGEKEGPRAGKSFILINADIAADASYATHLVLHEGAHAASANAIYRSPALQKSIRAVMKAVDEAIKDEAKNYALTDPHEFVAEVFGNAKLQDLLQQAPAPRSIVAQLGGKGRIQTMWDGIVEAFRRVLGLEPRTKTLLDAAMRVSERATESAMDVAGERAMARYAAEPGAEGKPQLVIPGAEQRPAEALQRRADQPLKPGVAQKEPGGMFDRQAVQEGQPDFFSGPTEKPMARPQRQGNLSLNSQLQNAQAERLGDRNWSKLAPVSRALGFGKLNTVEARVKFQDKFLRWKRLNDEFEKQTGRKLPDTWAVYKQESLYYGRAGERLETFERVHTDPLIRFMKRNRIALEDANEFLMARHAPERNAQVRKINPNIADPSGMSDAEAAAIIQKVDASGKRPLFDQLERRVRAMIDETLQTQVRDGLISQEMANAWKQTYANYVPLRGFADGTIADQFGFGKGYEIRGPEARRALGRESRAEGPIPYVISQGQTAIIRGARNRVGQAAGEFVANNPNPELWSIDKAPMKRIIDPQTGMVKEVADNAWHHDPDVFAYKVNGDPHYIRFEGAYGTDLARALKNIGTANMNQVMRFISTGTRTIAKLATSLNPEFLAVNFLRDAGEAFMNLPAEQRRGLRRQFGKHLIPSIGGSMNALMGRQGGYYTRMFREFDRAGGRIRFMGLENPEQIGANINRTMRRLQGGPINNLREAGSWAMHVLETVNSAIENGTRVATYIAARKIGLSPADAASMAREMTVNFNRKGEWGSQVAALYMFANANIQGPARMLTAMKHKSVRRGAYGLAAFGAALAVYNVAVGGKDKDGKSFYSKMKPWERDMNLIIMWPQGMGHDGQYGKVPLPYGYSFFKVIGDRSAMMLYDNENTSTALGAMLGSTLDAFNPIGRDQNKLAMFAPTLAKPAVHIATNEGPFGYHINPPAEPWNRHLPASQRYYRSATPFAKSTAETLNELTGGTKKIPGAIDWSPGSIDYALGFVTGGLGRFIMNAGGAGQRLYEGQEWQPEKTPFVRRLYGETGDQADSSLYFKEREKVQAAKQTGQAGPDANLAGVFRATDKQRKEINAAIDRIKQNDKLSEGQKEQAIKPFKEREQKVMLAARRSLERARAAAEKRQPAFARGGSIAYAGSGLNNN